MHTKELEMDNELDMVALWLRKDTRRWTAGVLAGAFAGAVAMALAMVFSKMGGYDAFFAPKLFGGILIGWQATDVGAGMGAAIDGFVIFELIAAIFGFAYAHFVPTNRLQPLLAMGAVWGIFSWIFLWNLFLPSFAAIRFSGVTPGVALPVCMTYGLCLASVKIFDKR